MNVKTGRDPALGTAPVGKLFWKLALPAIAAQLVNVLYNIVDRIYIGHIPVYGATALTGVGVTMPAIMIISAFAALVSAGGAPRAPAPRVVAPPRRSHLPALTHFTESPRFVRTGMIRRAES